jgi:hypothetical protein
VLFLISDIQVKCLSKGALIGLPQYRTDGIESRWHGRSYKSHSHLNLYFLRSNFHEAMPSKLSEAMLNDHQVLSKNIGEEIGR